MYLIYSLIIIMESLDHCSPIGYLGDIKQVCPVKDSLDDRMTKAQWTSSSASPTNK